MGESRWAAGSTKMRTNCPRAKWWSWAAFPVDGEGRRLGLYIRALGNTDIRKAIQMVEKPGRSRSEGAVSESRWSCGGSTIVRQRLRHEDGHLEPEWRNPTPPSVSYWGIVGVTALVASVVVDSEAS